MAAALDEIQFTLHNELHTVNMADITPRTTLLQYLRRVENLTGTKYMCLEGGCGACVVAVTGEHPVTKRSVTFSVNSCLVPIYLCQGWNIHTIEGIGNKKIGFHPVQKTLAAYNGTQCGFCSPGMCMSMFSLYEANATMQEIEDSFGSNMCRCTGYRPILSAFKSLASDAAEKIVGKCSKIGDIETCHEQRKECLKWCTSVCAARIPRFYSGTKAKWYAVKSVNEIFDILSLNPSTSYQLVGGHTARGVYPDDPEPDIYIDVTKVQMLITYNVNDTELQLGANMTLTEVIKTFKKISQKMNNFSYLSKMADHIQEVAHVPVRNIGTLAGNLMIKHHHNEFPSDIFLILETVGATLNIAIDKKHDVQTNLVSFLSRDMRRKVIKTITLPALNQTYYYDSYKLMVRAQNAHAMVNAGFLVQLQGNSVKKARLTYGGISPEFTHATQTEDYLIERNLFDNNTLHGALDTLNEEIKPDNVQPQAPRAYRKNVALALFYKFVLSIAPNTKITTQNKSGGQKLVRPISKGTQIFQSNESQYPLTQPVPKIEALWQTSGELEYITDMYEDSDILYAAFVESDAPANTPIDKIDPSPALALKGVVAFFGKDDIPGVNNFVPLDANYPSGFLPSEFKVTVEELFCSGTIKYYNQPIGLVVAIECELAEKASKMVEVTYKKQTKKPYLNVRDIIKDNVKDKIGNEANHDRTRKGSNIQHVFKGTFDHPWQYHYHMETQTCVALPKNDGLVLFAGTQWMDIVQLSVAHVLGIPEHKITIIVSRIGGGFGSKIVRNTQTSSATALAAWKLNKPVKMHMSFSTNMDVVGHRPEIAADYEIACDNEGVIQYVDATLYYDYGIGGNEPTVSQGLPIFSVNYNEDTWQVVGNYTKTDSQSSASMRAPGSLNSYSVSESMMQHAAVELGIDPIEFRLKNINSSNSKLIHMIKDFKKWSDYSSRLQDIENFNQANRWRKKGIAMVPMTYPINYTGLFTCLVTIYVGDGTVAVMHAGIEIGQGINTKVAQVCAYSLGISLDMVNIKPSNNVTGGNCFTTGGSITSELVCYACAQACQILNDRIKPVKQKMKNSTWQEVVKECFLENIDLTALYVYTPNDPPKGYQVFAVAASEVEVDILTGLQQILRVDILEDLGNSMSPVIDVGQVEGAFVMGLGYWLTEDVVFDENGKLLTNRTWNYKIPGAKDIPIDFRIKFLGNSPNPNGIFHSKTAAEPPSCLTCSVAFAIRHAVASARLQSNPNAPKWYFVNGPCTPPNNFLHSLNDYKQYTL